MAVAHLSQDWLDRQKELFGSLPARPGASARLHFTVLKTPDGDVSFTQVFEDGRLIEVAFGAEGEADAAFTVTYPDAQLLARDELDLHAGFMQGRIKFAGDVGRFMAVLPATQSAEAAEARAQLAAETTA